MGYLNNGIGAARINDSSPSDYTTYSGNKIETKQNSTDNTLTTTSKTIVGAINEINSKVNNKFIIAQTLPVSDIDEFAIYLIPKSTSQTDNIYDEYIYISTDTPAHWEKIGDTEIDLSGYYTSGQVDNLLSDKQDATDNSLVTTDKTIVGAINEHHAVIGYSYDEYDDTATYSVGDLCIYNNALYKCTTAITTAEAWNASHWTATSIADEIAAKANASTTYTKSQVDTELGKKQDKLDGAQLTNTDLNTLRSPMTYYLAGVSSTNHAPVSDCWGIMEVVCGGGNNVVLQRITTVGSGGTGISQYERLYFSRTWTVWKTITRNIS